MTPDGVPKVICIAGPTASGKSGLAVKLARRCLGEGINADALQVYSDLRVISARPNASEMNGVPHHLFGHIDGAHRYSTGQWLRDAAQIIPQVMARGHTPIVVGGTGLYFKALTQGLAQIPKVSMERANEILRVSGISGLREAAERLDAKAAAKVLGRDPQRLLRIVSVALETEKPLSHWQEGTRPLVPENYYAAAVLMPARAELYGRINARFDQMVEAGGLKEVRRLTQRGLAADLPVMRAIGVKTVAEHIRGERTLESAIDLAKRDTRRFAKRQMTWFRGQAKTWPKLENISQIDQFIGDLF